MWQREALQDEIEEINLQLEQLKEKRTALSQALIIAEKEEEHGKEEEEGGGGSPDELEMFENPVDTNLSLLQWRSFGPGKKGEWTFATDRNGRLMEQLEHSPSFVSALRENQRVNRGSYNYKISQNGRFLHRFPAEEIR